jgi:hypothetical protein
MSAPPATAEIAREIARTRERLSRSLARLDREYALRHLVVRAGRLVRAAEKPALSEALRREAAPLAILALGLGWLGIAAGRDSGVGMASLFAALERLQQLGQELGLLPRHAPPAPAATPSPPDNIGLS